MIEDAVLHHAIDVRRARDVVDRVLKPQNSRLWYQTVNGWIDQWCSGGTDFR